MATTRSSYYPNGTYPNGYYPNDYYPGNPASSLWVPAAVAFLDLMGQGSGGADNGLLTGLLAGLLGGYGSPYGAAYPGYGYPAGYYGNTYPSYYGTDYPANVNVAWVPLAPSETSYPWWGTWQTAPSWTTTTYTSAPQVVTNNYYRTVTVENVTKIYRNVAVPNAVTVVSARNFAAGRFADRIAFANLRGRIRTVAVVRNALPIMPTAANLRVGPGAAVAVRPASFAGFPAVAHVPAFTTVRPALAATERKAYRLPETRAQLATVERAHPVEQGRPLEQARPVEQARPIGQARPVEQARPPVAAPPVQPMHQNEQTRPFAPVRPVQAAPMIRPREYAPPPAPVQRPQRAYPPERSYAPPARAMVAHPAAQRPPAAQRAPAAAQHGAGDGGGGSAQTHHQHDDQ